MRLRVTPFVWCLAALVAGFSTTSAAQQVEPQPAPSTDAQGAATTPASDRQSVFRLGETVVVVGTPDWVAGVGGSVLSSDTMRLLDRNSLDQAVNVVPGVVSTLDANGRRNESDIFVRGFGRWQVPLMVDGVRIYLPADNRLDFSRFLTADIAEIQIQKGYASVLDGPGAMGGAINLVTRKPARNFEAEGGASFGGRSETEGWSSFVSAGTLQRKYYVQGSANYSGLDFWTLSGNYAPTASSLQQSGKRLSSDSGDSRYNVKAAFTPNETDEYTVNYIKQIGDKGAPLNVYNNPPVPANSYWRWPYWDVQNTAFLSKTQLGSASYVKTKAYFSTFANGLKAYDDITYTTQSANGRFDSLYDDHAYGADVEIGTTHKATNTLKAAAHYRTDVHTEQTFNRPTHPTLSSTDPEQERSQNTWSIAAENTFHATPVVDIVGGIGYDKYDVTKAEGFTAASGVFEYPQGGSDAFNWQGAAIWRYSKRAQLHASVSDRARFPVLFELYSTRFGTATPNPDLGPEHATNTEVGWKATAARATRVEAAVFYSNVRDLIQTVVLPDATTQTQNVGDGRFYGVEVATDTQAVEQLRVGANYTYISRTVHDALQPNLRPTGVPTHKGLLFAAWQPTKRLSITPSLDLAGDRWSDVNPAPAVPAIPYVRTGAYTLFNLTAEYALVRNVVVGLGFKNLNDDNYQLAWGLPQPGRVLSLKARVRY